MKVLLIVPTYNYKHHYPSFVPSTLFPTGFAYLASALKDAGHQVVGLNPNNIGGYVSARAMLEDQIEMKRRDDPDLIGIGGLCTEYAFIKDAMEIARKKFPEIPIVLGGGIITHDAEYIFNLLKPDFGIIGEGEEAIVQLANAIEDSSSYDLIPNLYYWEGDKVRFSGQNFNYSDINTKPLPDYDVFNIRQMSGYVMSANWWYRYTRPFPRPWVIITARSCPFSCTFCVHHGGPKYRARSIESIIEEIRVSYIKYRFNILIMMDELFAVNNKRMKEFCLALLSAKQKYDWDFDWAFQTHASANLDRETLQMAKDAGCFFYSYGMESASPAVLASMNKRTKPQQIIEAIKMAHDAKLCFAGNFIFGDPAETEKTVQETVKFLVKYCTSTNTMLAALRPYPGSKIFDTCIQEGIIKDKLDFYEHIDETPWNMTVNMTSIPSKKWLPLLDSIVAFGQLFPWVKSAVPYRYEKDRLDNQLTLYTGQSMYNIWLKCPHCGENIYTRELLALEKGKAVTVGKGSFELLKNAVIKAFRLARVYYLGFNHPIYRLLRASYKEKGDLIWNSFLSGVFFMSGCPHCNKIIKVRIPIRFTVKSFSMTEIRRRFRLI